MPVSTKNDSRQKILEAAARLFNIQGYHATGLNQILKESGAPKGSLYYHFPDGKEQLAVEAVNRMAAEIEEDIMLAMNQYDHAVEALQFHITKIANHFDGNDLLEGLPIGLLAAETSLMSEPLRKACKAAFEGWEKLYYEKMIEDGFSQEKAYRLSLLINSMIEGAITRSLTNLNGQPLLNVANCLPDILNQ